VRTVSAGLKAAMSATPHTLGWLGKFVFANGTTIRVSSTGADVTFNDGSGSATWTNDKSFMVSPLVDKGSGEVPDCDLTAPVAISDAYDAEDVFLGVFEGMQITLYLVDWTDPGDGSMQRGPFMVSEIIYDDRGRIGAFECRGILQRAKEVTVEEYSVACRSALGDQRPGYCNVPITSPAWLCPAVVASVTNRGDFTITVSEPHAVDGWCALVAINWLTGNNAGTYSQVRLWTQSSSRVQIWGLAGRTVQVGDTLEIIPGCDKRFETCLAKFANSINFRGEHLLPGRDFLNGAGL